MPTNFVPNGDRILVRPIEAASTTVSGLITIPDSAKKDQLEGIVVAVGPNMYSRSLVGVAVGTKILFGKYSGYEVTVDYEKLLLMKADEVFGHYEEKK